MALTKSFKTRAFAFTLMCLVVLCSGQDLFAEPRDASDTEGLFDMSIEELLEIKVPVASKKSKSTDETPGVVNVVTRDEIEHYGDSDLHQLMQRKPSVYTGHSFAYSDNLVAFRGDMSTHQQRHTPILFKGRPIWDSALGAVLTFAKPPQ